MRSAALQVPWRRSGKRSSSELRALFKQLRDAQSRLERASGVLEKQFLTTSEELQTLSQSGDEFVTLVERLVGLATGKDCDQSVFADAIQLIQESTRFLTDYREQTAKMLELLQVYNAQIEQLLGVETELQRTMQPLKYVQILFKAESATLGAEIQQTFGALTQEIDSLHSQVREIFGTNFAHLKATHQTIEKVIEKLGNQVRSLEQVSTSHKAKIDSSIATLNAEMTANQRRDVRLARLSKDLAHEVQQIVMGLQFQDIVNQKLQHVTAALPQIESDFGDFDAARIREQMQFLHQSSRLEALQVKTAQEELAKAETSIKDGIDSVLARLTEMDSECLSLNEFKLLTTSFDGMVQVLVELIEEVRELVELTVTSAAEAYQLLQPLGSLASNLTAVVRSISSQIHLIGLNAQVQAAQATQDSRGAGLEVLSARTSEISAETNRISEKAAEQLDALAAGLAESVKTFEQLRGNGLSQQTVLNVQGRTSEQLLHAFRDHALETLRAIGASLDKIRGQAKRTLEAAQFSDFHQSTLPALIGPLDAMGQSAELWMKSNACEVAEVSLIDGFKSNYTMASERKVFSKALASAQASATVPQRDAFESELFIDTPSISSGKSMIGQQVQTSASNVVPITAAAGDSDLGANVELF